MERGFLLTSPVNGTGYGFTADVLDGKGLSDLGQRLLVMVTSVRRKPNRYGVRVVLCGATDIAGREL